MKIVGHFCWIALIILSVGCGLWVGNPKKTEESEGSDPAAIAKLPLLGPSVRAATPDGFQTPSFNLDLSSSEFKNRFFSMGPTNIFTILDAIDGRIAGINKRVHHGIDCLNQEAVAYEISTTAGSTDLYAQCYEEVSTPSNQGFAFVQFGRKDGVTYLYDTASSGHLAAIVTPIDGKPDQYEVRAWIGIGHGNAVGCSDTGTFDGCSYGVIELEANPSTKEFEMSVAGIGFGYCGAQLRSDGTSVYAEGSTDGLGCMAVDTLCIAADDLAAAGECSTISSFSLPALGRKATSGDREWEASQYPQTPNVLLNGTPEDAIHFGPSEPTSGVRVFK